MGLLAVVWITACSASSGQPIVTTFQKLKNLGIDFDAFDKQYASPIHGDTALALLKTEAEQEHFENIYRDYLAGLNTYLFKEDFKWDKPFTVFQKIYFAPDGTAEYFLYNLLGPHEERPDSATMKHFEKSVAEYVTRHPFPIRFTKPFAQCAPMMILPEKTNGK